MRERTRDGHILERNPSRGRKWVCACNLIHFLATRNQQYECRTVEFRARRRSRGASEKTKVELQPCNDWKKR